MLKARKKSISVVLVLTMLATMLFAFAGTAMAATTNSALTVPNVTLGNGRTLGTIRIAETTDTAGSIGVGTEIMLTLPSGTSYQASAAGADGVAGTLDDPPLVNYVNIPANVGGVANRLAAGDVGLVSATTQTLVVRVNVVTNPANPRSFIEFTFGTAGSSQVNITGGSGDLKVNIYETSGAVTSGDVVVARIITAGTTATSLGAPGRTEGNNRGIGTIRIMENSVGALPVGVRSIDLVLPDGFTWNTAPAPTLAGGFGAGAVTVGIVDVDAQGRSRVRLDVNVPSVGLSGVIDLVGYTINIAPTAPAGDVVVSISGNNPGLTPASLTVAKVISFGVDVSAASTPDIYAGRWSASPGAVVLTEKAAGSLVGGRTITLTLPQGVAWRNVPVVNVVKGNAVIGAGAVVAGTNNRTVSYTVTAASTSASAIEFRQGTIDINVDVPAGNIDVAVGGTATASGTATIAKVVAPLAAAADKPDVKIGVQNQAAGDVTITENGAGVLLANPRTVPGNLVIMTPAGVSFAALPTVAVTQGNLVLNTANMTLNAPWNNTLTIPVQTSSSQASTIKISNIKLTLDRTVPEGALALSVGGSAVDMVNLGAPFAAAVQVANGQTITPAPPVEEGVTATFTIGSTTYTVGDTEQTMDVAPFVENGRTYLPIRYVAYAVGVSEDNIMWDGATSTATLIKGDRVVQLTINSNKMLINGATITMDVPAKMVSGRTMLPVRWVGNALGCQVNWDEATQTVTVTQ